MTKRANSLDKYFETNFEKIEPTKNNIMAHSMVINKNIFEKLNEKEPEETIIDNYLKKSLKKNNLNFSIKDINFYQNYQNEIQNSILTIKDIKPEYLKIRQINNVEKEYFEETIVNLFQEKYDELENYILNLKLLINSNSINQAIGPFSNLDYLLEESYSFDSQYKNEILDKKKILENILFYRKIRGDGNCFYRCIIFQLFEFIILNNKIDLLRGIINEIYQCFENKISSNILNDKKNKINAKLILRILIIIYLNLRDNNIEKAYKIFCFSINSCKSFDLGIIWYYRFTLYNYILRNQNKSFSPEFDIFIGNLLPEQFEKNGRFLYDNFFDDYLLKLYTDAEKIVIYLTPYIFGVKLNIFMFDGNSIQQFNYEGKSNLDVNLEINIINKKAHYELLYSKQYYEEYKNYFDFYKNDENYESIFEIKEKKKNIDNNINNEEESNSFRLLDSVKIDNIQKNDNEEKSEKKSEPENIINNKNKTQQNERFKFEKIDENEKKRINQSTIPGVNFNINDINFGLSETKNKEEKSMFLYNNKNQFENKTKKVCSNCLKNSDFLEYEENKTELCENCLLQKIREECLSEYYICLTSQKKFDLSKLIINIKGINFKFFNLINLLQKINPLLTLKDFQNTIKSMKCVNCQKDLNEDSKKITLNCGCCICDNCSFNEISIMNPRKLYFRCPCGEYIFLNEIKTLYMSILNFKK